MTTQPSDDKTTVEKWLIEEGEKYPATSMQRIGVMSVANAWRDHPAFTEVTDDTFVSLLCEGVHTGLRKGSEAPSSGALWKAISDSNDGAWGEAMEWTVWCLHEMGFKLVEDKT